MSTVGALPGQHEHDVNPGSLLDGVNLHPPTLSYFSRIRKWLLTLLSVKVTRVASQAQVQRQLWVLLCSAGLKPTPHVGTSGFSASCLVFCSSDVDGFWSLTSSCTWSRSSPSCSFGGAAGDLPH